MSSASARPGKFDVRALPTAQREVLLEISNLLLRRRAQGYLVGGFIRDYLKGNDCRDLDITVAGIDPDAVAAHIARRPGFSRPVVFPRFRTVMVVGNGLKVEVCRLEGDLAGDALRRDFTVNCLYIDLAGLMQGPAPILDPTRSGIADLKVAILRAPSDPLYTLWLDPLRMLRAARFHATDGFRVDAALARAVERMAYLLVRVSQERIRGELERILLSRRIERAVVSMQRNGILCVVMPEVAATSGFEQGTPYHAYDLFTHLVKTAAGTPSDLSLRLAGLLHDVGKTAVQMRKGGRMVYYGHETASAQVAASLLRRLRFSNRTVGKVEFLVANHMINYSVEWSDKAVRRFERKMGPNLPDILSLAAADRKAQRPGPPPDRLLSELIARLQRREEAQPGPLLPIDGRDIMAILGIEQGPAVGEAKEYLTEEALNRGRPLTRADAIALLGRWSGAARRTP